MKKSTKKSLMDELSDKLLRLKFKSNNSIEIKSLKYIKPKKYCLLCKNEIENLLIKL